MSKAQLQTNNARLSSLIETLRGKAAGSGDSSGGGDTVFGTVTAYTYTVGAVSGASYGFVQNSAGYWESENKGVNSSYAICRVNFEVAAACDITFDVINYAESNYDYGMLGVLDTALALSSSADSTLHKSFKGLQSASVVTVTYSDVPAGSHFIDVKFIKDSSVAKNNDSIQFKVQDAPTAEVVLESAYTRIQAAESDLLPENIRSGVDILGVTGTLSGSNVGTCNVTVNTQNAVYCWYTTTDSEGNVIKGSISNGAYFTIPCLCNSLIVIQGYFTTVTLDGGAEMDARFSTDSAVVFSLTAAAGESVTITLSADTGGY